MDVLFGFHSFSVWHLLRATLTCGLWVWHGISELDVLNLELWHQRDEFSSTALTTAPTFFVLAPKLWVRVLRP